MRKFWIVDAFTSVPFAGGGAAIVIYEEFPDDLEMLNIAKEFGFSNSAFIKRIATNHYHIKWFTPHSEAPLCGHATLAACQILNEESMIDYGKDIVFDSMSGQFTVSKTGQEFTLTFPSFAVQPIDFTSELRAIVGIEPVFCGEAENTIIMEYKDMEQLKQVNPDLNLLKKLDVRALITTAQDTEYDFASRYFAPKVGIDEDPVCASAHCRLIPYWSSKLKKDEMIAYQASSRGGVLKCKNLINNVLISGEAVTIAQGNIKIGT